MDTAGFPSFPTLLPCRSNALNINIIIQFQAPPHLSNQSIPGWGCATDSRRFVAWTSFVEVFGEWTVFRYFNSAFSPS